MAKAFPWILLGLCLLGTATAGAQTPAPAADSRHSRLREAMLGMLPLRSSVPVEQARQQCLTLPVDPPDYRLQGPHGDSLVSSGCEVRSVGRLESLGRSRWMTARYSWTSVFSAEDRTRGAAARDTVAEEEVVLFEADQNGTVRPAWHSRFETGNYAIWRSITPELAPARGGTLLSVMQCVNGTGGCSQEFLLRHPEGRWIPVWQAWLRQLPRGLDGRIRHGARIDPRTLRGEAGLYGDRDPNCCPSQNLIVHLTVRGDSLVLLRHAVRPALSQ
jgi:hypothetical protein